MPCLLRMLGIAETVSREYYSIQNAQGELTDTRDSMNDIVQGSID